ncbi:hypothetical protein [Deinococcus sp. UR1]|uniref:hypothetical protein n=1 Tax=Deinococcus sp. UR1 TaxID=1704277 RepID=UPI0011AFA91A|nr:hypothetical protein [Deinococcus sp. UR1]
MDTYVTVLDLESDTPLHRFGPFMNAATARVAAGAKAGKLLSWVRQRDLWRAEAAPHAYLVPADSAIELPE